MPSGKKGKPTWRPAQMMDVRDKNPEYTYRWCDKDSQNIQKKLAEGWEFAKEDHIVEPSVNDGKPLGSTTEYRELVLMKLPKETAEARSEYYQNLTDERTAGLKRRFQKEAKAIGPDAEVHGRIVID